MYEELAIVRECFQRLLIATAAIATLRMIMLSGRSEGIKWAGEWPLPLKRERRKTQQVGGRSLLCSNGLPGPGALHAAVVSGIMQSCLLLLNWGRRGAPRSSNMGGKYCTRRLFQTPFGGPRAAPRLLHTYLFCSLLPAPH